MPHNDRLYRDTSDYLLEMITRIQQLGSRLTDFTEGSVTRSVFEAHAAALSEHSAVAQQLHDDSYLESAVGEALDRKAADHQVDRKAAIPAGGQITITRATSGASVVIPAGWGELATLPSPGAPSVSFVTTEDAVFDAPDLSVTVQAIAVTGGKAGNIAAGVVVLPVNPVAGFSTQGDFKSAAAFTGGVDAESDDELRARVPIEVQGRVKGRREAFEAAALRVPGVESVNVLRAGDSRGDATTVPGGSVEVYFEGVAGLLDQVTSEVLAATVVNQAASTAQATAARIVLQATVYCQPGVDTASLEGLVRQTLLDGVNSVGVGKTVRASHLIRAVDDVDDVISVAIPFTDLRLASEPAGTSQDLELKPREYASLLDADLTVTIIELV